MVVQLTHALKANSEALIPASSPVEDLLCQLVRPLDPVICQTCGSLSDYKVLKHAGFICFGCDSRICHFCGCTDSAPCVRTVHNEDGTNSQNYVCSWARQGRCSFCFANAASLLYEEVGSEEVDSEELILIE